jgi:hypothetical protein
MDERVAFFRVDNARTGAAAAVRAETMARPVATAALKAGAAAMPKRHAVAAPKRVASAGGGGGPVGRMQSALASAIHDDPEWREF